MGQDEPYECATRRVHDPRRLQQEAACSRCYSSERTFREVTTLALEQERLTRSIDDLERLIALLEAGP